MTKKKVVVSNHMIRAVQRLSLAEKRLLMLAITKIDRGASINQVITVTADEYSSIYSVQKNNAYKALKIAESKLWDRELVLTDALPRLTRRWIISKGYIEKEGQVEVRFHPDLDGHVINLKSHFTQYLLTRAADFKHLYSWRLFELLVQFRKTGALNISVDEFKEIMEVPTAYDKDFGMVRRKVLDPAVAEIRDKDGLDVSYSVTKQGRKITGLEFTFPVEQQAKLPLPKKSAASKPPLSTASAKKAEQAAELAHLEQLAKLAGVPIETLTKKEKSPA